MSPQTLANPTPATDPRSAAAEAAQDEPSTGKRPPFSCGGCASRWGGALTGHCAGCHETFGGVVTFDLHRRGGRCRRPEESGLVRNDSRGYTIWSQPGTWTGPEADQ